MKTSIVEDALLIATSWHYGVKDKNAVPYIFHPIRMASMAQLMGLDEEVQAICLLHDVVEDENVKGQRVIVENLAELIPNERVLAGVDAMTRRYNYPHHETYMNFVSRVAQNADARKVKMLDNADNMRPERGFCGMKLATRYVSALRLLTNACIIGGDSDFLMKFRRMVTWVK